MNEEKPKSIWKKPLKSPGLFGAWLILLVAIMLILSAILMAIGNPFHNLSDLLKTIVASLVIATVLFCFWLFIRWVCRWRNFKKFLFGLACFATLIALFYAEEDWRGKHDWNKFKHEQEAKGERFDWQSIVPPTVPDDENFAFSPVWIAAEKFTFLNTLERAKAWYGNRIYDVDVDKILPLLPVSTSTVVGTNMWSFHSPPDNSGTWAGDKFLDLKPFQAYYRDMGKTNPAAGIIIAPQPQTPAQDVLLALSKFDPVIEQLRRDSAKPYSRFPLQYDEENKAMILLPHLAAEKRFALVLRLRAVAELQNGESEKALGDLKLMLRLVDASRNEPFLISHLVRIAILNLALQPIWEGLAEHKWSDTQLTDLDSELTKLDFLSDYGVASRGERELDIWGIEFLRKARNKTKTLSSFFGENQSSIDPIAVLFSLAPSGWFYQNERHIGEFYEKWYLPIVNQEEKTASPALVKAAENAYAFETTRRSPENMLERILLPALGNGSKKFAYAQSSTDLARVALALERYRLANGNYPESLDALAPKFISKMPHDAIGGESLKYRRDANGQFVLYSVGWNERDDGGVVVFKKSSSPSVDIGEGDWVWKYPKNKP